MKKKLEQEIEILKRKFEAKMFNEVLNETLVLIKKNNNDFLWNLLGLCHQNLNSFKKASECFNNAIDLNSKNIAAINNLGISYKNLKKFELAEDCFNKVLKINSNYINALVNLGNLKNDTFHFDEALNYYNQALKLDENNFILYLNIANVHSANNNIDKAEQCLSKALKINPKFTKADQKLSMLKKYNNEKDNHLIQMLEKFDDKKYDDYQRLFLCFGLAKAYEDISDFKKSINFLIQGNKLQRNLIKYNPDFHNKLSEKIKKFFDKNEMKNFNTSANSDKKIFVLGMPRSGTTLVEQIISSHSKVFSVSETNFLSDQILRKIYNKNDDEINIFLNSEFDQEYFEFIKNFNTKSKIILDKTLNNFWIIGFIFIFFPEAKVIHVNRNAKDNCLSIFKNFFDNPDGWNCEMSELANYYNIYKDLMIFWNNKFKEKIYNIKYESLVNNSENEIKKLIKHCDLEWEENCLQFYKNKNIIKTVSVNQANKPIYKSSINKSEYYNEYLDDLFSKLN